MSASTSINANDRLAQAIVANPDKIDAWLDYFKVCYHAGDVTPAMSLALELVGTVHSAEAVFHPIAQILHANGLHDAAVQLYEKILQCAPAARKTHSDLLIHKQLCGLDDRDAFDELERWNAGFIEPVLRAADQAETSRDPDRPLRVGFVSNDFAGEHSLNTAIAPWFWGKEHRRNVYILYSNAPAGIPVHSVFRNSADIFRHVAELSDSALDQQIRRDRIDILVDMVGHMNHSRLVMYAHRPAPIIVSWIGIGIPTGSRAMDYFLADDIRVPAAVHGLYRENIATFPQTAMVWAPPASAPPLVPPPCEKNGYVTFGNLSRIVKIQSETLDLWANVLRRLSGSKLLLKDGNLTGQNSRRLIANFEKRGIEKDRLIIRPGSNQFDHLATYNEIDVVLDCFPQQGGVSSLEALWMGVPVVSYCHLMKPAGRVGLFILSNLGLSALAVESVDGYVETASFIAGQSEQLRALRSGLRNAVSRSPICNVELFQHRVDSAFRTMWDRYCRNMPPEGFVVDDS